MVTQFQFCFTGWSFEKFWSIFDDAYVKNFLSAGEMKLSARQTICYVCADREFSTSTSSKLCRNLSRDHSIKQN